jgi:hypothetical protein
MSGPGLSEAAFGAGLMGIYAAGAYAVAHEAYTALTGYEEEQPVGVARRVSNSELRRIASNIKKQS